MIKIANLELIISYNQISVFDFEIKKPFSDWDEDHIRQGFAWRSGSVSFVTIDSGPVKLEIVSAETPSIRDDAVRAIQVPFFVSPSEKIGIASPFDEYMIQVRQGQYKLVFETGHDFNMQMWIRFIFITSDHPTAKILKSDSIMRPDEHLRMTAAIPGLRERVPPGHLQDCFS